MIQIVGSIDVRLNPRINLILNPERTKTTEVYPPKILPCCDQVVDMRTRCWDACENVLDQLPHGWTPVAWNRFI
jgi:phage host-nuclease inhibitor protein Gam